MKLIINIALVALIGFFLYIPYNALSNPYTQALGIRNIDMILTGMFIIMSLLSGIILAVINKK